jgi:hypothetical protein
VTMRTWTLRLIAGLALVFTFPLPALAFVPRAGGNVVFSESIKDDLYIAGGSVTVNALIDGDVTAAGGAVELNGQVTGGVLAAGGALRITGTIGRNLRAAGGTLSLDARVARDAILAGGSVNVTQGTQIGRDLVAGGGNITVSGIVGRDAVVRGGNVVIAGTIHGNARVRANRIVLLSTARIGGKLRYSATEPIDIRPGARIAGGTEQVPAPARPRRAAALFPLLWARVAEGLALLVLGLVIFDLAPWGASAVVNEMGHRFGRSLLAGFVLLVAVPVAAALVTVTIIGIPLSLCALLLYLATVYPGQVFVAGWLGRLILQLSRRTARQPPAASWSVVVGTIVLVLLFAVPYGGWAFRLVSIMAGFGALWVTIWRSVTSRPEASEAPSPAVT